MKFPRYLVTWIKAIALIAILDPGSLAAQSIEESEAWAAARFINTTAAYRWFLEMFPDGQFAMKAFAQIAEEMPVGGLPQAPSSQTGWSWGPEDDLADAMY